MATAHTYYLAYRDRCLGERAHDAELAAALKSAWERLGPPVDPSVVDGVSAWLDEAAAVQLRVIRKAACEVVADPELTASISALLQR